MIDFGVNITIDDVLNARKTENGGTSGSSTFDPKKYLDTNLPQGVTSKLLRIRLLPYSPQGGVPFHKVFMHVVKVDKSVSPSGWKSIPCVKRNGLEGECPFCETATKAFNLKKASFSQADQEKYNEVGKANLPRAMWVVRCIDRDHEEDGVKFWMFNDNLKGEGIHDKIESLCDRRINGESKTNIYDLNAGKDLEISIRIGPDGKKKYDVADAEKVTPLTEDVALGKSWINDETKWTDLYKAKPYEYMDILLQGKIPYYSKADGCYVAKDEIEARRNGEQAKREAAFGTQPTIDLSTMPAQSEVNLAQSVAATPLNLGAEDDLPF